MGATFEFTDDHISAHAESGLRPVAVQTDTHPGFMTDWQPPLVTALTQADGVTVLHETVYEDRLGYTEALRALGAQIQVFTECLGSTPCRFGSRNHRHSAVIVGPAKLQGTDLHVPDLRAGFSYVLAALSAQGTSTISGASLLDRGYENFRAKLAAACIVDEEGNRLFSEKDVAALGRKSAAALDRVATAAQRISAMSQEDVDELAGN